MSYPGKSDLWLQEILLKEFHHTLIKEGRFKRQEKGFEENKSTVCSKVEKRW